MTLPPPRPPNFGHLMLVAPVILTVSTKNGDHKHDDMHTVISVLRSRMTPLKKYPSRNPMDFPHWAT